MPDIEKIKEYLTEKEIKIIYYEETDSTNKKAREYAKANPENRTPAVFIAKRQSAGRGRLGRSFHSDGSGLYISFLLYPSAKGREITAFTPFAAVKLCEAVEGVAGFEPRIKWVNDLYVNGKKLAGILVEGEMDSDGNLAYIVCGLGINVYKTALPEEISQIAISVEEVISKKISMESLAASLIDKIIAEADSFASEELFSAYLSRLDTLGKDVTVIKANESYEARAEGLNPDYSLVLSLPDGRKETLFTGEVSIRAKKD